MKSTRNTFINFIVLSIIVVLIGTVLTYYPRTQPPGIPVPSVPAANSVKNLPENLPVNRPQEQPPIEKFGNF